MKPVLIKMSINRCPRCYRRKIAIKIENKNQNIFKTKMLPNNQGEGCNLKAENTHLFRKGKLNSTADLLIDWFGFGQTSKSVVN